MLIAGIVQTHSLHAQAYAWLGGKQIVLCPIVELGFLRISTNNKSAIGLTMKEARIVLNDLPWNEKQIEFRMISRLWIVIRKNPAR